MADSVGSLICRAAMAAGLLCSLAAPLAAQQPLATAPASPEFLSHYDFHLEAAGLASGDERFSWDTHFGGAFDFVDYVHGRTMFLADYQAVLGSEYRPFDPNQGNYNLAAGSSVRLGKFELFGVLHHESRHLGDRPKRQAVAWNDLDATLLREVVVGDTTIDMQAMGGKIIAHAWVDYSWVATAELRVRRQVNTHAALYGRAVGEVYGIDSSLSNRGAQQGGRLEGGVRFTGSGGALELFGGYEQVVDADPFDRVTMAWPFLGFRIVSR